MKQPRRTNERTSKPKVALPATKGIKTLAELSSEFEVHPNQITEWKQLLQQHAAEVFGGAKMKSPEPDIKSMHAKIGQLSLENDFLESALTKAGLLSARR